VPSAGAHLRAGEDMMASTVAEKLLSAHNVTGRRVYAGEEIDARVDRVMLINYHLVRAAYRDMGYAQGPPTVFDPDRVFVLNEHVQPPRSVALARANAASRRDAERLGISSFVESEPGVCHQIMLDRGWIAPGELIAGNDSHVTAYGGVNAAGFGVGTIEAAYLLAFGQIFLTVPESIRIVLHGSPRSVPFAKDVILHLAGRFGAEFASDRALEFSGPFVDELSVAARTTLADHATELGATFGFVVASDTEGHLPDPNAKYAQTIEIDCDALGYQVACPYTFDNVVPVNEVAGRRIDQARLGSCANGRFEDVEIAARMLAGRRVADGVRFYVSPASGGVLADLAEAGHISTLLRAGAQVLDPGCAICQTPGIVLNEEVCISATTRNSRGRMGGSECGDAQIFLAGPATVTASAIAGHIAEPQEYLA
jgi:3-isopropylmalate/(R)-2-methylmalate dehydratase large subunit